jgi:predicted ester cyclase
VIRGIWEDALNAKNLDKALTLVTDDAKLVLSPAPRGTSGVFNGKEELRGWWEEFAVRRNGYVEFTDFHVFGNNVVCTAKVSDDGLRAMGVAPVYMNGVSIVQNDLLKSSEWTFTEESLARFNAAMMQATNKAIARRFLEEIWNQGNMAAADELVAEDFINHAPGRGVPPDREGLKQEVNGLLAAFFAPFTIDDLIAEGDKVVIRGTFRSVHNGEFLGVPATGKEVTHTWTAVLRIEDGKVVERWADVDRLKFMMDLGILPAPGQGGK